MAHGSRHLLLRVLVPALFAALLATAVLGNTETAMRTRSHPPVDQRAVVNRSTADPAPDPANVATANRITATVPGWASWSLLDRRTGRVLGDPRSRELTNIESTIKVWLAAEMLREAAEDGASGPGPSQRARTERMIRHSSDSTAENVYLRFGGDAGVRRMIEQCGLRDAELGDPGYWARVQMSSRDTVRMLDCVLLSDRILPPSMRGYLLAEMRRVDEPDAFGIQDAHPAGPGVRIAVKNGWTANSPTGLWNLNCTGVWGADQRWVLAVMTRYDISRGQHHGERVCTEVTRALFTR